MGQSLWSALARRWSGATSPRYVCVSHFPVEITYLCEEQDMVARARRVYFRMFGRRAP